MADSSSDSTNELRTAPAPSAWRLRAVFDGKDRLQVLRRGEKMVLGSSVAADWTLEDPTVSSRHCELVATNEGIELRDLDSKNGTFIGAGRVERALLSGPRAFFSVGCTSIEAEARRPARTEDDLGLIGNSDALARIREQIQLFAPLKKPVLILGESGTGKDLVAQALHACSNRSGRYVPLNTAALPEGLLDAELFGHSRGAFTGAVHQRAGLFEEARDGTLFLDEIADLGLTGQAKLLRVVEDGKVRALGAGDAKLVSVRLVAATCKPLLECIERGQFRLDLFHRLSTLTITLPPLRERRSDIAPLALSYLSRIEEEVGRKRLSASSMAALVEHDWPGNVRELFAALYRAAVLSRETEINVGHLAAPSRVGVRPRVNEEQAHALLDRHQSVSAAARAAGLPRSTFRALLARGQRGPGT